LGDADDRTVRHCEPVRGLVERLDGHDDRDDQVPVIDPVGEQSGALARLMEIEGEELPNPVIRGSDHFRLL